VPLLKLPTIAGTILFVLIVIRLHFLRRDLPPLQRGISRYAGGTTLALTTVAFFALATALASLAVSLPDLAYQESVCLMAAGAGIVLGALTPVGRASTPALVAVLHIIGGLSFYLATAGAMVLSTPDAFDTWLSRGVLAALVLFFLGAAGVTAFRPLTGLFQRLVFVLIVFWLVGSALR
jgi:hypothetical protein